MNKILNTYSGVIRQSTFSFIVRVLGAISAFVVSLVVVRMLGAEESGYYFLAFSIVTFLAAFSRAGLDSVVVRFTSTAHAEGKWGAVNSILSKSIKITLALSIPLAVILFFISDVLAANFFDKPRLADVLQSMAPGLVALALLSLFSMSLQGLHRAAASVFSLNVLSNLIFIAILLWFGLVNAKSAGWCFSISVIISTLISYAIWMRSQKEGFGEISWTEIVSCSKPLWVVMVMGQTVQWSVPFLAGIWLPSVDVAMLTVAQRTSMLTSFVFMAVNIVVVPRFAAMYKRKDMAGVKNLALYSVRAMVLLALPILVVMLWYPEFIMSFFGDEFKQGAMLLQIMCVAQFVSVATGSVSDLLAMTGHSQDLRSTVLISGFIAILGGVILVPAFGATGGAIANALAIVVQNMIAVFYVRKRLGINMFSAWGR